MLQFIEEFTTETLIRRHVVPRIRQSEANESPYEERRFTNQRYIHNEQRKWFLDYGKLLALLVDTEEQAQELFSRLVKKYAEKEGVTEQLKSPTKWCECVR